MPSTQVNVIEQAAFDGPFSVSQTVVIGVLILFMFTVTLLTEQRRSGRKIVWLFWILRCISLVAILWMLLGPTLQTTTRQETNKTVAVVVDVSESMQTIDPPHHSQDIRWNIASKSNSQADSNIIILIDKLLFSLENLNNHFHTSLQAMQQASTTKSTHRKLSQMQEPAQRAMKHLQEIESLTTGEQQADFQDISNSIETQILPHLKEMLDQYSSSEKPVNFEEINRFAELQPEIEQQLRVVKQYAHTIVSTENQANISTNSQSDFTRFEKVETVLGQAESEWLNELSKQVNIKRYVFDSSPLSIKKKTWSEHLQAGTVSSSAKAEEPEPTTTNMTAMLELLSEESAQNSLAAVIMVTDGKQTAKVNRSPERVANSLGDIPIFPVPIGNIQKIRDVILHTPEAPSAVMKEDSIIFETMIDTIHCEGETLLVALKKGNQVIEQKRLDVLTERTHHRVSFTAPKQEIGRHHFTVSVQQVEDESREDNNTAQVTVDVIDDNLHILLADEMWRWEYRYLVNLFDRDSKITFDHLVFQPKKIATGELVNSSRLPQTVNEWSRYRAVILGDLSPENFDLQSQESLREYITKRGGHLVLIAGSNNMPHRFLNSSFSEILPVEQTSSFLNKTGRFSLHFTPVGRSTNALHVVPSAAASERIWEHTSQTMPLYYLSEFCQPKPTSHSLVSAVPLGNSTRQNQSTSSLSFLTWHTVGRGSVTYIASPSTYHLRARKGDLYHHRFWGQLLRSVIARDLSSGSRAVKVRTAKTTYSTTEPIEVVINLSNQQREAVSGGTVEAVVKQQGNLISQIKLQEDELLPGRYTGKFNPLTRGKYEVNAAGRTVEGLLADENHTGNVTAQFNVEETITGELVDTRCDLATLEQLAELTGGTVIPPTSMSEVSHLTDLKPIVTEQTRKEATWPQWSFLFVICGCLIIEWTIRKRIGFA